MVEQELGRPVESRKTILICDDEPALRELVRASLDDGYRFAEASDGLVALELARELEPDAVILDLMLPRLGGLEVLAQLQADAQLSRVPVLVITAWNETREDVLAAGAAEFVTKPFDPDTLRAAVKELLNRDMTSSRFSSFSLRSRMLAASAVLAALVIGVFVALILAISALQAATKQEARSKEVTASALMLEKLVLDVETGVRGYALTGKQTFLKPYRDARDQQLPSQLDDFEELASREPSQRQARGGPDAGDPTLSRRICRARRAVARTSERRDPRWRRVRTTGRIDDIRGRFKRILETEDAHRRRPQAVSRIKVTARDPARRGRARRHSGLDAPLRALSGQLDRAARPRGGRGGKPLCERRAVGAPRAGRPG